MTEDFNPWDKYAHLPPWAPVDIPEPPCKNCKYWEPIRDEETAENCEGLILCHADKQFRDFSCYKKRDEERQNEIIKKA